MTALASRVLSERGLEMMRLMAPRTARSFVKGVIARGRSMAATARLRDYGRLRGGRMCLVTGNTRAARSVRVIGVNIPVAIRAGGGGRLPDIVRRMATRAARVLGDGRGRQHLHGFMTRTAVHRFFCRKCVRPMTVHALRVATGKQCRRRDERLRLFMTPHARRERRGGRRVLLHVARLADRHRRLALHRVRRLDLAMTVGTIRRHRRVRLMGRVTIQTRDGRVHPHCGQVALNLGMTTRTVRGQVRVERPSAPRTGFSARKRVTIHAVRPYPRTKAGLRLGFRVLDGRAFGVTAGTTSRGNAADRSPFEFVAAVASDALLLHVDPVPRHTPSGTPIRSDVHAATRRATRALVRAPTRTTAEGEQHEHTDPHAPRELTRELERSLHASA